MKLDLSTDPPPSAQYDLIYTLMTLHHVPDTEKLLRQFYLLLKETGALCIGDLEKEDGSFHGMDSTVHKGFHRGALKQQVLSIGFSRAEFYPCYTITKKTNATVKTFPLFLMVAEKQGCGSF
jgi:ubiquinone/menaquinone biosynthesis C-methylase UbiE